MGGTFISVNEQLAQQALDTIETLKSQLAEANARIDALTKGRGGMKKSAVERLAELELRDRGEHVEIGILSDATHYGNFGADPRGVALVDNMLDGDAVKRVRKTRRNR